MTERDWDQGAILGVQCLVKSPAVETLNSVPTRSINRSMSVELSPMQIIASTFAILAITGPFLVYVVSSSRSVGQRFALPTLIADGPVFGEHSRSVYQEPSP